MANLNEDDIKKIAEEAVRQLGGSANTASVENVVRAAVTRVAQNPLSAETPKPPVQQSGPHNRIIVTAFGKNHVGILAGLTGILAEHHCDILDLSQKILQEFFTIMLLVDITDCNLNFEEIKQTIIRKGEELDLKVIVQHEDIFNTMHRI